MNKTVKINININRPLTIDLINTKNNTVTSGTGSITGGELYCTTITTNNNTFTSGAQCLSKLTAPLQLKAQS
jgi:hypothetical protein